MLLPAVLVWQIMDKIFASIKHAREVRAEKLQKKKKVYMPHKQDVMLIIY